MDKTVIVRKNEQPDMRKKVQEYIDELQTEIRRLGEELEENMNGEACMVTEIESKINNKRIEKLLSNRRNRFLTRNPVTWKNVAGFFCI